MEQKATSPDVFEKLREDQLFRRWTTPLLVAFTLIGLGLFLILLIASKWDMTALNRTLTKDGGSVWPFFVLSAGVAVAEFVWIWRTCFPLRWKCPGCRKSLHGRIAWRCDHCKSINRFFSVLNRCGNFNCWTKPLAFECPDCKALSYFTNARDGRSPARDPDVTTPAPPTDADVKAAQARELEQKEHQRRSLEADRNLLAAEVEVVRLRRKLNQPEPEVVNPRQARVKWVAEQLEAVRDKCTSMQRTMEVQQEVMQRVEVQGFTGDELSEIRRFFETQFEGIRQGLQRGEVQL